MPAPRYTARDIVILFDRCAWDDYPLELVPPLDQMDEVCFATTADKGSLVRIFRHPSQGFFALYESERGKVTMAAFIRPMTLQELAAVERERGGRS
jgi:hypothetical protein